MRRISMVAVALTATILVGWALSPTMLAAEENHCFTCHTNARKLIKIIREIEESRKDEPEAEIKSEGEG